MLASIAILLVEDSEDDALLLLRQLRKGGFEPDWERVETISAFRAALNNRAWDAIIADYRLPGFEAPAILDIVQQHRLDLPFIVASGTIGEEAAVAIMKAGAHDYLRKDNLTRLPEILRRELRDAHIRAERRTAQVQLYQTAQREKLTRLVTERIRQSLDLDTILATTVTEVRHVLHVDRVVLFQLQENGQGCVVQESADARWPTIKEQTVYEPCFHSKCVERYVRGRVQATADIEDGSIPACYADFLRQFQVRANLVVPVIQSNGLWGLLIAHHCAQPRQWAKEDIQLLRQLADQVAIAIQQANLYQQVQQELAERRQAEIALQKLNQQLEQRVIERTQALQQKAEQEYLLRLVVQNIHRSLDFDHIIATVLDETRQSIQADRVAIYQFLPDWSGQFIAESVGEGWVPLVGDDIRQVWEDTYLQENQGGRYQRNETLAVHDIYAVGHTDCHIELLEQFQARAYVIVPIFVDDQLWGLLAAYQNSGPRAWQDSTISLLQQISVQTAIALRQSYLYQLAQGQVQELEKLNQLKDDFLSTVSHELRSPLANIKMALQMVKLNLQQQQVKDARLSQYLQILEDECSQELALINDLLDLQRLEADRQSLYLESINPADWLSSTVESFADRAAEQQQDLSLDLSPNLPPITTDLVSFKRIVSELLHNACKYTPPHERILVTAQTQNNQLQIQVRNTGVELPAEELAHIFEKFYRIARIDRRQHGGTGLGLALVKRLAKHLHGSIEVESSNSAVCFTFCLPYKL